MRAAFCLYTNMRWLPFKFQVRSVFCVHQTGFFFSTIVAETTVASPVGLPSTHVFANFAASWGRIAVTTVEKRVWGLLLLFWNGKYSQFCVVPAWLELDFCLVFAAEIKLTCFNFGYLKLRCYDLRFPSLHTRNSHLLRNWSKTLILMAEYSKKSLCSCLSLVDLGNILLHRKCWPWNQKINTPLHPFLLTQVVCGKGEETNIWKEFRIVERLFKKLLQRKRLKINVKLFRNNNLSDQSWTL